MSPYRIVFDKKFHLPIELEHKAFGALKFLNFNSKLSGKNRLRQLNELDELTLIVYENETLYKERRKRWHNTRIKQRQFQVKEKVLVYNSCLHLFPGKL